MQTYRVQLSARSPSSVCLAGTGRHGVTGQWSLFHLCASSGAALWPPWGSAGRAQGNPLGVSVQTRHRPSEGQRFIMLESQDFSHHRRPKRQNRRPFTITQLLPPPFSAVVFFTSVTRSGVRRPVHFSLFFQHSK
jgi:hypothetical protein